MFNYSCKLSCVIWLFVEQMETFHTEKRWSWKSVSLRLGYIMETFNENIYFLISFLNVVIMEWDSPPAK